LPFDRAPEAPSLCALPSDLACKAPTLCAIGVSSLASETFIYSVLCNK
jgi:hypothetical protein